MGASAGNALGNTLAGVTVNAAAPTLASGIGRGLASGLGSAAGGALGGAVGGGGGGGGSDNTVEGVDVVAPSGGGGDSGGGGGGALSTALANISPIQSAAPMDFGSDFSTSVAPPPLANLGGSVPTELAGIDVTAPVLAAPRTGLDSAGQTAAGFLTADQQNQEMHNQMLGDEDAPAGETDEERRARLLKKYGPLGLLGAGALSLKDLLALGLLGGGLALNGGKGGGDTPAGTALTNLAGTNTSNARALQAAGLAGMNGNIGGSGLNYVARMVRNAQAAIRQRYAGMGMSGSTAEQQDLNAAAQSGVDMQFKIGQEMAQTGLSAAAALSGQSATIYAALMNAQTQKDTQLGNALANFAGAVAK
jgi:hypothetical protein